MTIDQLSEKTILVALRQEDMARYSLDFSDGEGTRQGLTRLMVGVGEACGLDHRGKSYLIEALPAGDSCLLIISVREQRRRRIYRIKRVRRQECFVFDSVDALLDGLRGERLFGGLYAYEGGLWLIPDYPPSMRLRERLIEYATLKEPDAVGVARVRELGDRIADGSPRRAVHNLSLH